MNDLVIPFLISLAATIVGIIAVLMIERWRLPDLEITTDDAAHSDNRYQDEHPRAGEHWKFLRVRVKNKPLPCLLRWLARQTAESCHARVAIRSDAEHLFTMRGRWSSSPELPFVEDKLVKVSHPDPVSILPGESEILDIFAKHERDEEAYAWNNEAYFYGWRPPHHRLPIGNYVSVVTITTMNGISQSRAFRLIVDDKIGSCAIVPV